MKKIGAIAVLTLVILFVIFVLEPKRDPINTTEKVFHETSESNSEGKDFLKTFDESTEEGVTSYRLEAHDGEKQVTYGGVATGVTIKPKMTFQIKEKGDEWEAVPLQFSVEAGEGVRVLEEEWEKELTGTYSYTKSISVKGDKPLRRALPVGQAKKLAEETTVTFQFPSENYNTLQELLDEKDDSKMFEAIYNPNFTFDQVITFTLVDPDHVFVKVES
ncbi:MULTISPECIES: hypothetical protein [Pontibacillus]|uniref:Uncharacterized protein n=1 Tax=Pontibacillus chungwhensis TaxID=265426 RepID=A0ABY8UTP6_9BACI|nr:MULTISPECIES: hypothetical protein [Pontibacillus]MCD5323418.1 hypothetical protein [Pontibacillus sp. HN14]WIF96798.1 hypothetical protein QNI29_13680 [Pontibacillus chungwhensis]